VPQLKYPVPFLDPNTGPDLDQINRSASFAPPSALPVETLLRSLQAESPANGEQPLAFPQAPAAPMLSPAAAPKKQ